MQEAREYDASRGVPMGDCGIDDGCLFIVYMSLVEPFPRRVGKTSNTAGAVVAEVQIRNNISRSLFSC